ncbi:DUF1214 domain-containing protein [Mycolicibacterium holsaticum]|uniref:DUF1214 domain-containing protein n=1 Tax=Mycolicibacterium holsaticum TaxID=152142 RepID=UPI001C7CEFFF|nr:DUF1214 domain-containing protein [Mycolicibacterium holsaticum]MDA4107491.1 hypothetical protein [Mycolicibacterium holsaticum DSM 44478 = JCM 12374]QZA11160.1 DUF1214 domain-containing protein [Mycolicibacterium holsaticum DSM 44478 = JCM 12374]UNC11346.1 DUF1214 domain-containing protein [Mycolicibacterium holsaticum DSM 44478 = JCM 12374]
MTTTANTYGRFIGRVGALAVALGIGVAITNSPGIAVAEDGTADNADTTSASVSDSPGGFDTTPSEDDASVEDNASVDGEENATVEEDNASVDDEDTTVDEDATVDEDDPVDETEQTPPTATPQEPAAGDGDGDGDGEIDDYQSNSGSDRLADDDTDLDALQVETPVVEMSARTVEQFDEQEPSTATVSDATTNTDPEPTDTVATAVTDTGTATTEPAPLSAPTPTGVATVVSSVLSALGFGPQAANGTTVPQQPVAMWAMLAWARREIGITSTPSVNPAAQTVTTSQTLAATTVSPLGTPQQLAAERIARQTANSLPVAMMKVVLRLGFLFAAHRQYPGGIDQGSLASLNQAVNEYAMAAAYQQQLLNPLTPTVVTQVAPPHIWYGQNAAGSRILYDNPDTIYRFMAVSASSKYVITGRFHDLSENGLPADTTFSVLEGLAGTTSTILTADDLEINEDGTFVITVSTEPANGRKNHLQLTPGSTIIAARDTLGNWNEETPMSLSIERVSGPPNSLFAQIGGFVFLGPQVSTNRFLTTLVSLVPPLPYMPPIIRGVFTGVILLVRGVNEQAKYMALASTDPETGQPREANVLAQPSSNAEFLANQLQSTGHYQLADDQVLVLTIDPGSAEYFIVPTYNIWTITDDYWNQQTSLNNEQAIANEDGTYTVVISPTDPGAANWVSTGGLHQGAISIRFQGLGPNPDENPPLIVDQRVMTHEELRDYLPPEDFITEQQRAEQLALRKAGYDRRWAPYPQP